MGFPGPASQWCIEECTAPWRGYCIIGCNVDFLLGCSSENVYAEVKEDGCITLVKISENSG
jgi:hypothetical protein